MNRLHLLYGIVGIIFLSGCDFDIEATQKKISKRIMMLPHNYKVMICDTRGCQKTTKYNIVNNCAVYLVDGNNFITCGSYTIKERIEN